MTAIVTNIRSAKPEIAPHLYAPILLVPEDYELSYMSHSVGEQFNRGVLSVYFRVVEFDDAVIARYYNVSVTGGGKRKTFRPRPHSELVRDFRRVFTRPIGRLDRFPIHWLKNQSIIGEVDTVNTDYRQKPLDENTQYSVVRRLLCCA